MRYLFINFFFLQLKQLSDRAGKARIKQVDVINVNMSQVLEESQQWLQKNMTEEYAESKNVGSDINVTGNSKRKHQITYLAQQVIDIFIYLYTHILYLIF